MARPIQPPEPRVVHPLPAAPAFVGRERELEALAASWAGGMTGVLALVGLGGSGKTALAARFLADVVGGGSRPSGLFVWSFYERPDAGEFLREAFDYFGGWRGDAAEARGAGLLGPLGLALGAFGPHLLVLDGLERVQRQGDEHGRIEDPLLRGLLVRLAEGVGKASALVTSRFPLVDLEGSRGAGYRPIDVGGLDPEAAVDLLRRRGVEGDDAELGRLVEAYGAHALTLDHLGGLIGQFLGGDPARAPEAPSLANPGEDRQALRLARLLRAYEDHLPAAELALLRRLCLLRDGVGEAEVVRVFGCSPAVSPRVAREAAGLVAAVADPEQAGETLGLADPTLGAIEEAIADGPIAGPAEGFAAEARRAVDEAVARHEAGEVDIEGFLRLYADPGIDAPTDRLPLSPGSREMLRAVGEAYWKARDHPLRPRPAQHHDALAEAFAKLGWDADEPRGPEDRDPYEIERALAHHEKRIRRQHARHVALRAVRELCRGRRRKWELAGPLATLDAEGLRRLLGSLASRNLVVRDGAGSVAVHPAIRDHFAGLGDGSDRGSWHDLIREQLISLARRPGRGLPEDRATLDLIEEAIRHAVGAGRDEEAWDLFEKGLGGVRHLGWKLGESARGARILEGFRSMPDPSAPAWFLRALGELDPARDLARMPYFRADVRLLQGRLAEVGDEGDSVRAAVASFLMGERTDRLPPDVLGLAVPRLQLLLIQGRHREAWALPRPAQLYGAIGWEGDRARLGILLAEVARRQGDLDGARDGLDEASAWPIRSGSVEHLALWHLVRCRLLADSGDLPGGRRAVDEGIHLAGQAGMGLYRVLLLNARAEILAKADPGLAETSARDSLGLAAASRFRWGEGEAGHLLGQALAAQWRFEEARGALAGALEVRAKIGDPAAGATAKLLGRLPG